MAFATFGVKLKNGFIPNIGLNILFKTGSFSRSSGAVKTVEKPVATGRITKGLPQGHYNHNIVNTIYTLPGFYYLLSSEIELKGKMIKWKTNLI